jgi:hypothetical protein
VHLVFFRAFLIVFLEISRVLPTAVQVLFLYPSFFQLLSYKEVKPLWSYSMMAPIAAFSFAFFVLATCQRENQREFPARTPTAKSIA